MTKPYHLPPNDYVPPTRCYTCRGLIFHTRVSNGVAWSHVSPLAYGHPVTIRPEGWYDTRTGQTRHESVVLDREALTELGGPDPVPPTLSSGGAVDTPSREGFSTPVDPMETEIVSNA